MDIKLKALKLASNYTEHLWYLKYFYIKIILFSLCETNTFNQI